MSELSTLNEMLARIESLKEPKTIDAVTIELLDPHGHSLILHENTVERELTEAELRELPVGPDPAVFSQDDMN
jgi:C4-type Zn-finger protein